MKVYLKNDVNGLKKGIAYNAEKLPVIYDPNTFKPIYGYLLLYDKKYYKVYQNDIELVEEIRQRKLDYLLDE
jgi:hypothetical protein